jgi:hypothetical protein
MPRALSVNSLPEEVQNELRQRLLSTGFGQFDAHVEWLSSKGFTLSRSSIHRYATANAPSIMSQQHPDIHRQRLRCGFVVWKSPAHSNQAGLQN